MSNINQFPFDDLVRFILGQFNDPKELEDFDKIHRFVAEHFECIFDVDLAVDTDVDDILDHNLVAEFLAAADESLLEEILDRSSEMYFIESTEEID